MDVRSIMSGKVIIVSPESTLKQAAELMKEHDIGFLPVYDGMRVTGALTDRDISVRGAAEGRDSATPVEEIMTREVWACPESFDASEAARLMQRKRISRLIVVDVEHRPVGILSLADLALKLNDQDLVEHVLEAIARQHCHSADSQAA